VSEKPEALSLLIAALNLDLAKSYRYGVVPLSLRRHPHKRIQFLLTLKTRDS
jgi:hypothetical protein